MKILACLREINLKRFTPKLHNSWRCLVSSSQVLNQVEQVEQKRLQYISAALSELVYTAHNEQKLMPKMNPSASQEIDSVDDDTWRVAEI
jgi:hypothetical protein